MPRTTCSTSSPSWASQTSCRTDSLRIETRRQTEEREEDVRVEEEREPGDPAVRELEHLEGPRRVAVVREARPVLPERGRAVRPGGRKHARAATTGPRADHPAQNVVAAP